MSFLLKRNTSCTDAVPSLKYRAHSGRVVFVVEKYSPIFPFVFAPAEKDTPEALDILDCPEPAFKDIALEKIVE